MRLATSSEAQADNPLTGLRIVLRQQARRTSPEFVNARYWQILLQKSAIAMSRRLPRLAEAVFYRPPSMGRWCIAWWMVPSALPRQDRDRLSAVAG